MSTPAQVGKNEYRAAIRQARQANETLRGLVGRMLRESASPVQQALAGQMALKLVEAEQAISRLDEIGQNARGNW